MCWNRFFKILGVIRCFVCYIKDWYVFWLCVFPWCGTRDRISGGWYDKRNSAWVHEITYVEGIRAIILKCGTYNHKNWKWFKWNRNSRIFFKIFYIFPKLSLIFFKRKLRMVLIFIFFPLPSIPFFSWVKFFGRTVCYPQFKRETKYQARFFIFHKFNLNNIIL